MPIHAPAKLNLCLFLGRRRGDGLHELCSLFEPLALADLIEVSEAERDEVLCEGVEGENLAERALAGLRERGWERPPLRIEIAKRIPVAAGSAAAPPTPRRCCGWRPARSPTWRARRRARRRRALAARPVPGPGSGCGERVARLPDPEPHAVVLLPGGGGLATAEVFAEADRLGLGRGTRSWRRWPAAATRPAPAPLRSTTPSCSRTTSSRRPAPCAPTSAMRSTPCARRAHRWRCSPAPGRPPSASSPTSPPHAPPPRDRPRRRDRLRGWRAMRLPGGKDSEGWRKWALRGAIAVAAIAAYIAFTTPGRPREGARGRLPGARRLDLPAGRRLRLRRDRRLRRPARPRRDGDDPRRRRRRPGRDRHLPRDRDRLGLRLRRRHDQLLRRPPARARVPDAPRPALRGRQGAARPGRRLLRPPRRQNDLPRPLRRLRARLRAVHRRQLGDALPGLRPLQHPRHRDLGRARAILLGYLFSRSIDSVLELRRQRRLRCSAR